MGRALVVVLLGMVGCASHETPTELAQKAFSAVQNQDADALAACYRAPSPHLARRLELLHRYAAAHHPPVDLAQAVWDSLKTDTTTTRAAGRIDALVVVFRASERRYALNFRRAARHTRTWYLLDPLPTQFQQHIGTTEQKTGP